MSMAIPILLAQAELDGVSVTLNDDDSLNVQGTNDPGYWRWAPVVEDLVTEIVEHLRESRANPSADVVRHAEGILRSPGGCC